MTEKGARSNANDHLSSQSGYNFEIHFVKASGIRLNFKYLKICGQVRGGYQTLVFEYIRKKKSSTEEFIKLHKPTLGVFAYRRFSRLI